jgi:transcriptional regulator PpsR
VCGKKKSSIIVNTDRKTFLSRGSIPLIEPELLSNIISTAADISILFNEAGIISSVLVNPHHRSFGELGQWIGKSAKDVMPAESYEKFTRRLRALSANPSKPQVLEINHVDQSIWEFPVRYSMHQIESDNSILMLGRDMRPIAEMQQQLVLAQLALERDYEHQREMDTRYRVLMESTREAFLLIALNTGRISDLNPAAAALLGAARSDLIGGAIAQEFEGRRRGEFLESLSNLASAEAVSPVELVARRSQRRLRVVPVLFRAAGERLLMCRMDAEDDAHGRPDELTENLGRLFHEGVDGVVFVDAEGLILNANDAFFKLTDSAGLGAVRGRTLADFLSRGSVDLRVLLENTRRARQLRLYATRLKTAFDSEVTVEISATYLNDRPKPCFALLIRDASRTEVLRRPGLSNNDDGMRSVMELVGSSTLKDIVAETTDVVEKMCIQTAVELTRNNRVAAAEMLGLSRQSLYVKLRKFDLLTRDDV